MIKILLLLAASPAQAFILKYRIDKPDPGIMSRVEASTGLILEARCRKDESCAVNGYVISQNGQVIIEIYEKPNGDNRSRLTKVSKDLQQKITAAVLGK